MYTQVSSDRLLLLPLLFEVRGREGEEEGPLPTRCCPRRGSSDSPAPTNEAAMPPRRHCRASGVDLLTAASRDDVARATSGHAGPESQTRAGTGSSETGRRDSDISGDTFAVCQLTGLSPWRIDRAETIVLCD